MQRSAVRCSTASLPRLSSHPACLRRRRRAGLEDSEEEEEESEGAGDEESESIMDEEDLDRMVSGLIWLV